MLASAANAKALSGGFNEDGKDDVALTGGNAEGLPWTSIPVAFSHLSPSHAAGSFTPTNKDLSPNDPAFGTLATNMGARPVDVETQ